MDRDRGERQAPRAPPRGRDDLAAPRGGPLTDERERPPPGREDDALPFDVELERAPAWTHAASGFVLALGALVATRVVPMLALLPALALGALGRRFASVPAHVEARADALDIGDEHVPAGGVLDVWHDSAAEGTEKARVIVAVASRGTGQSAELLVCHFENPAQARRFAGAFSERTTVVAGHRPRARDALSSLRFAAIAAALFGTGSGWLGGLALAYFVFGAVPLLRARQIVAGTAGFTLRSLFGGRSHAYADVARVDDDAGVVTMKDGAEVRVTAGSLRDATLASPPWRDAARARVLRRIAAS